MTKPPEYEGLTGEALIQRVMRDRNLSRAGALHTISFWENPEGDVVRLPDLPQEPAPPEGDAGL